MIRSQMTASTVLSNDSLRRIAPSIFAATPWERMSQRYKMVPTIEVIDTLRDKGFLPVKAAQSRSRIPGKGDFTRHMVRLRHTDFINPLVPGQELPELVLTNSHDGTASYCFHSGIFRVVCQNGLLIAAADFGGISVKHSGGADFHSRVLDATFQIMDDAPRTLAKIEEWKQISLPAPQQQAFAQAAHTLLDNPGVTPESLLEARRAEDRPDADGSRSLWKTYNTTQEAIMKGGIRGTAASGRRTTTRPVKSVTRDIALNRALSKLAEEMAKLVGG